MFTCSSCGYEANPDSAPACSLCGTKKPGAGGSAVRTAPKPAGNVDDELARAAKAVADSAEAATTPAPARPAAKGGGKAAARGGSTVVTETHTGILKLPDQPPDLANSTTMAGAFVGTLLGYLFSYSHNGHFPAGVVELLPMIGCAVLLGLIARFALTNTLESQLTFGGKEAFAGPIAGLVGVGFLLFTIFAFYQGSKGGPAGGNEPVAAGAVGKDGKVLAEHVALLTQWNLKLKNEKHAVFNRGTATLDIPAAPLTEDNLRDIQKAMGVSALEVERLAAEDPCPPGMQLPAEFTIDRFIEQIGPIYGVQKDTQSKPAPGKILLARRRVNGSDEQLTLSDRVRTVSELAAALPKGVKPWIGVALGLPAHNGQPPEHDRFVNDLFEKYAPQN
ncbi:MAG: hypothetical protein ACAI25_15930 [Planctomycetota bacterium]